MRHSWKKGSLWISIGLAGFVTWSAAARAETIEGSWITSCVAEGGKHSKRDLYVVGSNIYSTTSVYGDAGCFNLMMKLEDHWTYEIKGSSHDVPGAYEVDLKQAGTLMTVLDASVADLWSVSHFCEYAGWNVGVPVNVTGKDCG